MGLLTRKRSLGFSLAEVLISIMVLSTLSVLLVGVIPASVIGLKAASQRAQAGLLARQVLEDARRDGFDRLGPVGTTRTFPTVDQNGTQYELHYSVEEARDSAGVGLLEDQARTVQVRVIWRSHVGSHTTDSKKEYVSRMTFFKQL